MTFRHLTGTHHRQSVTVDNRRQKHGDTNVQLSLRLFETEVRKKKFEQQPPRERIWDLHTASSASLIAAAIRENLTRGRR
jgi:hypothetical protein